MAKGNNQTRTEQFRKKLVSYVDSSEDVTIQTVALGSNVRHYIVSEFYNGKSWIRSDYWDKIEAFIDANPTK